VDVEQGGYPRNIRRALENISELTQGNDIEVVVIFQTAYEFQESQIKVAGMTARKDGLRFINVKHDQLATEANSNERMTIGKIDDHPSPAAHRLVAEELLNEVWDQ
jgi:hypothetical protein